MLHPLLRVDLSFSAPTVTQLLPILGNFIVTQAAPVVHPVPLRVVHHLVHQVHPKVIQSDLVDHLHLNSLPGLQGHREVRLVLILILVKDHLCIQAEIGKIGTHHQVVDIQAVQIQDHGAPQEPHPECLRAATHQPHQVPNGQVKLDLTVPTSLPGCGLVCVHLTGPRWVSPVVPCLPAP